MPSDQPRLEILMRLERELHAAEARLRDASEAHALARSGLRLAEARLSRAQSLPTASDVCLLCWVNHQRLSHLRPVASPQPRLVDQWRCEAADCGHIEDRRR